MRELFIGDKVSNGAETFEVVAKGLAKQIIVELQYRGQTTHSTAEYEDLAGDLGAFAYGIQLDGEIAIYEASTIGEFFSLVEEKK